MSFGGWGALAHQRSSKLLVARMIHQHVAIANPRSFFRNNVHMSRIRFTTKVCSGCNVEKPRDDFYKKLSNVSHKCKQCTLIANKSAAHKYFKDYRDYQNAWRRQRYRSDPEYRAKLAARQKARYERDKESINCKRRKRWATDPNAPDRKYYRYKDVKEKTPPWVDLNKILAVYAKCPSGHHVDHIVPLRGFIDGRPVSGLHVLWNLQYLPAAENLRKKNKITEADLT